MSASVLSQTTAGEFNANRRWDMHQLRGSGPVHPLLAIGLIFSGSGTILASAANSHPDYVGISALIIAITGLFAAISGFVLALIKLLRDKPERRH